MSSQAHTLTTSVIAQQAERTRAAIGRDGNTPVLALRPKEAAKALGIGERLLWEMTNRGEIPCTRIGRCVVYPVDSLRAWLAEQAEGGTR